MLQILFWLVLYLSACECQWAKFPLHSAASKGNVDSIKQLLGERDINEPISLNGNVHDGATPLHLAINAQKKDAVKLLIEKGADVNARRKDGWTPLHYSSNRGDADITRMLIEAGAEVNVAMNEQTPATPLHFATYKGKKAVVELLLKANASVNAKKENGETALHDASRMNHKEIVVLLLQYGANPTILNDEEMSPFHLAVYSGHKDIVKMFIDHGIDVNIKRNDGNRAIHDAANERHVDILHMLIDAGADVNSKNDQGVTPMIAGVHTGGPNSLQILEYLLRQGVDNAQIETALQVAKRFRDEKMIKAITYLDRTPLQQLTVEDMCLWTSKIGLHEYCSVMKKNSVDGQRLLTVDSDALKSFGIQKDEHIQHILKQRDYYRDRVIKKEDDTESSNFVSEILQNIQQFFL